MGILQLLGALFGLTSGTLGYALVQSIPHNGFQRRRSGCRVNGRVLNLLAITIQIWLRIIPSERYQKKAGNRPVDVQGLALVAFTRSTMLKFPKIWTVAQDLMKV